MPEVLWCPVPQDILFPTFLTLVTIDLVLPILELHIESYNMYSFVSDSFTQHHVFEIYPFCSHSSFLSIVYIPL